MYLDVLEAFIKIKPIITQFNNPPHDDCSLEKEFLEKVQGVLNRSVSSKKGRPGTGEAAEKKKGPYYQSITLLSFPPHSLAPH
jgi:hypothetical protein